MTFAKKIEMLLDLVHSDEGQAKIDEFWKENQEYDDGHRYDKDTVTINRRTCLLTEFSCVFNEFIDRVGFTDEEYYVIHDILEMVEKLYRICSTTNKESNENETEAQ